MSTADLRPRASRIISGEVRWLVAATACLTALGAVLVLGPFIFIPNVLIIIGAMISGYFPRCGKYLIWFGAIVMNLELLPLGFVTVVNLLKIHDWPWIYLISLYPLSFALLVVCCDIALFVEAFENKHVAGAGRSSSHTVGLLVRIAIFVMNAVLLPVAVYSWISNRNECAYCYEKPIAVLSVLAIVLLDLILAANLLKTRRVRRERTTGGWPNLS